MYLLKTLLFDNIYIIFININKYSGINIINTYSNISNNTYLLYNINIIILIAILIILILIAIPKVNSRNEYFPFRKSSMPRSGKLD